MIPSLTSFSHSNFGKSLGIFLSSGIQALDVRGIGMDSTGFSDAQKEISGEPSLVRINIRLTLSFVIVLFLFSQKFLL